MPGGAGVSLAGDLSIPAESPPLLAEASAATYSSSMLSSHSPSPGPHTPPDASTLLEAALSPDLGAGGTPYYGALHHLHAESSLNSGRRCMTQQGLDSSKYVQCCQCNLWSASLLIWHHQAQICVLFYGCFSAGLISVQPVHLDIAGIACDEPCDL